MTRFYLLAPVRVVQLCNGRLHNWQRRADIPRSDDLDDARSAIAQQVAAQSNSAGDESLG